MKNKENFYKNDAVSYLKNTEIISTNRTLAEFGITMKMLQTPLTLWIVFLLKKILTTVTP